MNHFAEQPRFEIQPTIEQKPFESPAVQSFFTIWCEINTSIQPQMIGRDDWEQRGAKGILEKMLDGKETLYIPKDLQLWEMVGVMEMVDHDTFTTKPERQNDAKKKLLELGKAFVNAGVYIAQRLGSIDRGRDIARALAEEFYGYGQSLMSGEKFEEQQTIVNIASHNLTTSELDIVDRFLAGDNLYLTRQARAEKVAAGNPSHKDEFYESERRKTLSQFFRVSETAFVLEKKNESGESQGNKSHLKPWQSDAPLHSAFLTKVEKAIVQKIETPKRDFEGSIFRRGMELLQRNMPFDRLPYDVKNSVLHWKNGEITLREALQLDKLKSELNIIRQTGNTTRISTIERKIADKIQKVVSGFPYDFDPAHGHKPSEMIASQYINCVGASTLGGALMQDAGLNYLVGDVLGHSILFLVTSDGHVEWRDMLNAFMNENLTDRMITGSKKDGSPLTVADVAAFSRNSLFECLMIDIKDETYQYKLKWIPEEERKFVAAFKPKFGHQMQTLKNTGWILRSLGRNMEAVEAYRQAVAVDWKYAYPYYGLGNALLSLGRNKEAIEEYQKFIYLADKQKDGYWINRVKGIIAELKNK